MKPLKMLTIVIAGLIGLIFTLYGYMGGFTTVKVSKVDFPATEIIYATHQGPYKGLKDSWTKFVDEFTTAGLDSCNGFGIYLDSPDTPPEKLRSIIACSVDGLSDELKATLKASFKSFTLPATEAYTSSFPFKNELSYFLAPSFVYPEFQKLIATNAITPSVAIEAYGHEKGRNKILFYMPTNMSLESYQPLLDSFNP